MPCSPSLVAQIVKNLPAIQETWVRSLGQEDPLEKRVGTHISILAWRISWAEGPGGIQSIGFQRVGYYRVTNMLVNYNLTHWMVQAQVSTMTKTVL